MNKKLLLSAIGGMILLSGACAYASDLNIELNLDNAEPVYAAPAPVYIAPQPVYVAPYPTTYNPYHRNHDWRYWHERRIHEHHDERWEREHYEHDRAHPDYR